MEHFGEDSASVVFRQKKSGGPGFPLHPLPNCCLSKGKVGCCEVAQEPRQTSLIQRNVPVSFAQTLIHGLVQYQDAPVL